MKELFKTSKGKYVAPAPIENLLNAMPGIELSCVMGRGLAQPVAVVQLEEEGKAECEARLEEMRAAVNAELEKHERLDRSIVSPQTWTIESGMLTPTMKIRRSEIEDRHPDVLQP